MKATLIVLEGKHKDREIPIPETIFLIGRDRQCHLRPHCQLVSKLHCAIAAWAGKVRVRDLKSRNGTLLNGQAVNGEVAACDGDRLQVGTLVFAFRVEISTDAAPPSIDENALRWLLEAPSDSPVLSPPPATVAKILDAESSATDGSVVTTTAEAKPGGSKAVSAGQHLRDYFAQRKRQHTPAVESSE